jgi:hypothetical protein
MELDKYKVKYLKYKNKYYSLKNQIGGNEWNILCKMPIIFFDISPDNKYIVTIHQHDINIWDINTYTLYAEFHIDKITFYNKEILTRQKDTLRNSYKIFDSSAYSWSPNGQYFAVSGNNYDYTIREDESFSNKQTTDEIIIIDCIKKEVIKRYKSDELVQESNVINLIKWNNTSTELSSISFIEQKLTIWNIINDETKIIIDDSTSFNETRISINDDFSLIMQIKKGFTNKLLLIKDLDYKNIYTINFNSSGINDSYFHNSDKNIIFVVTEYESIITINKYDLFFFLNKTEKKPRLIFNYKFNPEMVRFGELKYYYNFSPNLDYIYLCNNGKKYILNTKNNNSREIIYSEIYNDEIIWSENSKYFYFLQHNQLILINIENETISIININYMQKNIKLYNDKLFFLTLPNNIKIINTECLIKENLMFIEDDTTEFLNTEIINAMIEKFKYPLYQLRTKTVYNYINHKTNLNFITIENILNNKEKRLWAFTNKNHIADIFVFPTINSLSEKPMIIDCYLSKFQQNMILYDIKNKNIIHKNMNFGVKQEEYIQSNYFCIFYGYLSDFPEFNKKVNIRGKSIQSTSSFFIFDVETLLKKTIENIFDTCKEFDNKLEYEEEWSTKNMIYFNKRWPFGHIGKKEVFGSPMELIDYSFNPPKTTLKYMSEDTTLCDPIKYSDDEKTKNLKIDNFINKLICKIKYIPPEKIDKNELCIRFPIRVNLTSGLFKISYFSPMEPYTMFTYKDFPYNS